MLCGLPTLCANGYMMEHFDIDGLVEYGDEEIPGTTRVVNPAWRALDKRARQLTTRLRSRQARLGAAEPPDPDEGRKIQQRAALLETIQELRAECGELKRQRRATPRKVAVGDLPEADRPSRLLPLAKTLTDTVKMIAYRAETALVALLRRHLQTEAEARALPPPPMRTNRSRKCCRWSGSRLSSSHHDRHWHTTEAQI